MIEFHSDHTSEMRQNPHYPRANRVTDRTQYFGGDLLRHKPPFCFIGRFDALRGGVAEVHWLFPKEKPNWASVLVRSTLQIECAAQLMGARVRLAMDRGLRPGFLVRIKRFIWAQFPESIAKIRVNPATVHGEFHDFTAEFFTVTGTVCASMFGTLCLPAKPLPLQGSEAWLDSADSQESDVADDALFRVVTTRSDGNGRELILSPNPACSVYAGHFPKDPITPGVLLVEAMIDASCALVADIPKEKLYLVGLRNAVFQSPVRPGDRLTLKVTSGAREKNIYEFSASLFKNEKRCARANFDLGVLQRKNLFVVGENERKR